MHTQPTAADRLKSHYRSAPLLTDESWSHEKALRKAAAAELETDPAQCLKTAAWLERLADQYEAEGRDWNANENRQRAAELRAKAAPAQGVAA